MDSTGDTSLFGATRRRILVRVVVLMVVVAVAVGLYFVARDESFRENLVRRAGEFRNYERSRPVVTYSAAFILYVVVTALSLPVAAPLSLVYGWLFGFVKGVILVSFASTAGATCAFLLSRYVIGHAVQQRYAEPLQRINTALEREGAFYLFTLRLIPYVPFFVVNLALGLTKMRARTFWWVSQLGMLPGTLVYLWAGSSIGSLRELQRDGLGSILTPQTIIAFVALGVFPLIVKRIVGRFRPAAP